MKPKLKLFQPFEKDDSSYQESIILKIYPKIYKEDKDDGCDFQVLGTGLADLLFSGSKPMAP